MNEWKEYRLGEIASFTTGKLNSNAAIIDGRYPFFTCAPAPLYIDVAAFNQEAVILAGNNAEGNFAINYYNGEFNAYQRTYVFTARNNLSTKFLYYSLSQFLKDFKALSRGTATKFLTASILNSFKLSLPPITIQKKIAEILSSLDEKIETNRKINARLEELAQTIFKSWFIDFEPSGGKMPADWTYIAISDFPHEIETGKRPKGGVSGITVGIPSIGAESIKGIGYYDYSKTKYIPYEYAESMKKGRIKDFDLLIYKDGGKPGYFIPDFSMMGLGFPFDEMFLNEHVFRLNLGKPELNIFAYFFFKTDEVMNYLNSVGGKAAIPGINQKNVEDVEILDLDIPQVHKFGEIVLPMFKKILENCKESARLAELRDTLLPKLMSGVVNFL